MARMKNTKRSEPTVRYPLAEFKKKLTSNHVLILTYLKQIMNLSNVCCMN